MGPHKAQVINQAEDTDINETSQKGGPVLFRLGLLFSFLFVF